RLLPHVAHCAVLWPRAASTAGQLIPFSGTSLLSAAKPGGEILVRAWLDAFVIGRTFCPWARPADKRRNIRIVESSGKDADEVIFDLLSEAEALPDGPGADGQATTTLVVCPYVEEWKEYPAFRDFYEEELEGGSGFLEEFDMKIIAFHPKYLRYGFSVEEGDRVAIANANGTTSSATVLDEEGGLHPQDGEELLDVRFDDGEEFLVRYSSIITKLAVDATTGEERSADDGSGDAANLLSRAPRPTFHLLRLEDLDAAGDAAQAGSGPNIKAVLAENARRAADLGLDGMDELLKQCG
ncbi:unnamed protein product, partial [Symbiodinium pilosum]